MRKKLPAAQAELPYLMYGLSGIPGDNRPGEHQAAAGKPSEGDRCAAKAQGAEEDPAGKEMCAEIKTGVRR